jgi:hypothetical protein
MTPEQRAKILEMWKLGYGTPTIAARTRISSGRVIKYLKTQGLTRTKEQAFELRRLLTLKENSQSKR